MRWVYAGVYALMGPYAATYAVVYAPHLTECKRLLCHIILSFFFGIRNGQTNPCSAWSIESTGCKHQWHLTVFEHAWGKQNQIFPDECLANAAQKAG